MLRLLYWIFACSLLFFVISLLTYIVGKPLPILMQLPPLMIEIVSFSTILIILKDNVYLSKQCVLVIAWIIWVLLTCVNSLYDELWYISIITVLLWPLVFLFANLIYKKQAVSINSSVLLFTIISLICIYYFTMNLFNLTMQLQAMNSKNLPSLNLGFYPLCTIPWIFLIKRNTLKLLLLFIITIVLIFSMKRSIILILGLIALFYMFSFLKVKKIIPLIIGTGLFLFILVTIVNLINKDAFQYLGYRLEKSVDDGGSGRTSIYDQVLLTLEKQPVEYWIMGNGHNTVIDKVPSNIEEQVSAHNDFLEVLFDYGIIGLALYMLFHFFILKRLLYLRTKDKVFFVSYASSWIIFIVMSLISHLILYATYFIFLTFYWGMVEALVSNKYFQEKEN